MTMYRIHTVIDDTTGEIIPFTPDLLRQIAEVKQLIEQVTVMQGTIKIRIGEQRPVLAAAGDDLAEAFFEKREF